MSQEIIKVNGMHCKSCELLIIEILEDQDGINKAEVSIGKVIVNFDEDKLNSNMIRAIIAKEGCGVELK